jgi:hypothetical protein
MVFCYCFETEEMKTIGVEKTCYMSFFYVEIYCKITLKIHLFNVFFIILFVFAAQKYFFNYLFIMFLYTRIKNESFI